MKRITVIVMMIAALGSTAFKNPGSQKPIGTQITYEVDAANSTFGWHARKVTGEHFGIVKIAKGSIFRNKGVLNGGEFEMDMTSIADTDITSAEYRAKLDGHLKSEAFFDVAKFPKATFKIKIWAPIAEAKPDGANYYVKGDLTIKGITKEISFPAKVNVGENTITASADFNIDRTDFGLKYNSAKFDPGIGDKMVYDEFNVQINLIANYKK